MVHGYKSVAAATKLIDNLNTSCTPCDDFAHFVCDGWAATAHIPAGRSRLAKSFSELNERNKEVVEEIVKERWPYIGTYYESCLAMEARGNFTNIRADYDSLYNSGNVSGLMRSIAALRTQRGYRSLSNILFTFDIGLDLYAPQQKILVLSQAGFTLPTPLYYDATQQLMDMQAYRQYIISMFALTPNSISSVKADNLIELERRLAAANVALSSYEDSYNVYTWTQFRQRVPNYIYSYINTLGWSTEAARQRVQISQLSYFEQLRSIVSSVELETLKNAAIFALLRSAYPMLSQEYSQVAKELQHLLDGSTVTFSTVDNLASSCAEVTNNAFPVLTGHYFVDRMGMDAAFKDRALDMALQQKEAVRYRLQQTTWMDVATIRAAEEKLDAMDINVVYPESWEQIQLLERMITAPLSPTNFMENTLFLRRSFDRLSFERFSQPPNPNDWASAMAKLEGLSEVNAFYNPQNNSINIPAGIWQDPFYWDADWTTVPPALNFGGIGSVIGHEFFHGWDNSGRLFGKNGALDNWWSADSALAYNVKIQCVVDYYNQLRSDSGYSLNGLATLGEDIADIAGLRAAFHAYRAYLETLSAVEVSDMKSAVQSAFRGYNDEQLFFITYGALWCELETPAAEIEQIESDPHPPAHQRLHGTLANVPEFAEVFGCAVGSKYAPHNPCQVF
jgi:putative endopeptidase